MSPQTSTQKQNCHFIKWTKTQCTYYLATVNHFIHPNGKGKEHLFNHLSGNLDSKTRFFRRKSPRNKEVDEGRQKRDAVLRPMTQGQAVHRGRQIVSDHTLTNHMKATVCYKTSHREEVAKNLSSLSINKYINKQTNLDLWNRFYCTLNIDHAHQIQNFLSSFNFMYDRADYLQKLANTLCYKLVMGISY